MPFAGNRSFNTSLPEQTIFFYVRRFFPDAINRYKLNGVCEADIFIPSIQTAIEYDGGAWHKKRVMEDASKNNYFNENNCYVIRIRDANLPELPPFYGTVLLHGTKTEPGLHTNEFITETIHILANRVQDLQKKEKMLAYVLTYEEVVNDTPNIASAIYTEYCENNCLKTCIGKCWDYEMNGALKPENVPTNASILIWVKCPAGKSKKIRIPPDEDWENTRFCPVLISKDCYDRCDYIVEKAKDIVNGVIPRRGHEILGQRYCLMEWFVDAMDRNLLDADFVDKFIEIFIERFHFPSLEKMDFILDHEHVSKERKESILKALQKLSIYFPDNFSNPPF